MNHLIFLLKTLLVWKHITEKGAGYPSMISEAVVAVNEINEHLLIPVDQGQMIIASDYSGQHADARFEAYSFLVTNDDHLERWLPHLFNFRSTFLPDNRSMSFKKLNENVRSRAFPKFLETIGKLSSNVITILVDRQVGSFFSGKPEELIKALPGCFPPGTKSGTIEKMFRHATFVATLIAALRRQDQTSMWISDRDETLENHERREGFARLASYLTFGLTKWKKPADNHFCTTESNEIPEWAQDISEIADIFAGCYCSMGDSLPDFLGTRKWITTPRKTVFDNRALKLGNWLASKPPNLRHLLIRLSPNAEGTVEASAQAIIGRNERGTTPKFTSL